jgi:hypothetical protein
LPGGKSLSFASPKESNQRKGDPIASPLRVPKISRQRRDPSLAQNFGEARWGIQRLVVLRMQFFAPPFKYSLSS